MISSSFLPHSDETKTLLTSQAQICAIGADGKQLLPDQLLARKVLVIHIDEVQHLMHYENEQEGLANSLKGLMNNPQWPVSFVLSGLPKINKLILIDEQSERRQFSVPLPPVVLPDERKLVTRIISKLCAAAQLDCTTVLQSDLPERLAHAANYQFGRIAETTVCAIQIAILNDAAEIDRDHFANAYADRSHARDRTKMNPFLAADWQNLDPGFFVVTPPEDKQ